MRKIVEDRIYSLTMLLAMVVVVAGLVYPETFFTGNNFRQLLLNLSIDTIVAVGMMILLVAGVFDLSVGSVLAFAGCLTAHLMYFYDVPVLWATLAGILATGILGCVNGYLVAYKGINAMIQTLAMMGIARGLALMVSGAAIHNLPFWFSAIGQSRLFGVQMPVWYMLFIVALFTFLMSNTIFFRRYYYIGSNETAAALSGIRVKRMKMLAFVFSALLAGIAGILLTSRLGAALPSMGRGLELRVITAVILGGASLNGGVGKVPGALLGALFMGVVANIMVIARVSGYWQDIIIGIILITTLWVDQSVQKKYHA